MLFDPTAPAVSYLLGLLHTDGYATGQLDGKGCVGIELQERDVEVLRQLQAVIPCPTSLRRRTRDTNFAADYVSYALTFFDQAARVELAALGMRPGRKAKEIAPQEGMGLSVSDYLRGVLDGDGSVGFTGAGIPFVSLTTASEAMARFFEACIQTRCGVRRRTKRNARDGVFNVMVTNVAAARLAAYCWAPGAWPAIPRKAASAAQVAAWTPPADKAGRYGVRQQPWNDTEDFLVLSCSAAECAEILGRSVSSVSTRRWRLVRGHAKVGTPTP